MAYSLKCYIESYDEITILFPKEIHKNNLNKEFFISKRDFNRKLVIINSLDIGDYFKFSLKYDFKIDLHEEYIINDEIGNTGFLQSGRIVRDPRFDLEYFYEGPLGIEYYVDHTTFRVWSPVAKEIIVCLYKNEVLIDSYEMKYINKGMWETVISGNLDTYDYRYKVRLVDSFKEIVDPYGTSSTINGMYSTIIDLNKTEKMRYKRPLFSGDKLDAIIYEANVRDFSSHDCLHSINSGTFLGMLENHPTKKGIPTGVSYLKYLGVTHVQLMPVFDFGGVDDKDKESMYNWGYNPEQYFVPCGWLCTQPNHPYKRVNELKHLIDGIHANGVRVILDMVFNHVFDYKDFPFEYLVPGYFYRVDIYGQMTEVSGCQNDLATEKNMCRKFIIDCLLYYANFYHIDGFRFDLMGLMDIETMDEIKSALSRVDKTILLYGEGWNMPNTIPYEKRAHMYNCCKLKDYSFFNDTFRDYFRGSQWNGSLGYCLKNNNDHDTFINLILGSSFKNFKFIDPRQSINYVECHDNYTMIDYIDKYGFNYSSEQKKDIVLFALSIILFSQGVPFIHSGQEFMKSKKGIENSYNSGDDINGIDWTECDKNIDMVYTMRDLICLRKKYSCFKLDKEELEKNTKFTIQDRMISLSLNKGNEAITLIFYNSYSSYKLNLEGDKLIFDGRRIVDNYQLNDYMINKPGIIVLERNDNTSE